jgi:methanogenic corrinoid protein MtbC1
MEHLKPYFLSGDIRHKGRILMGTVAGAPVTSDFAKRICADIYSPDPQGALDLLNASRA